MVYTYTRNNLQDTVTFVDATGQTTALYDYDYDERNRLTQRTDTLGTGANQTIRTIEYGYDVASNQTSVTTASGTTTYTYDERNRLDIVRLNGTLQADYDYDAVSNLTQTTFGNGTLEIRQYDNLNRLEQLENWQGTTKLASYTYTLDKVGNRAQVDEFQNGESRTLTYSYDDLYRLTKEVIDAAGTQNDLTQEYGYDNVGNRQWKKVTANGATTQTDYTYDNNDRLLNEMVNDVETVGYTYDNNGSTLTKTEAAGKTTYTWDDEKRLIAATVNGQQIEYRYNDQGIRVSSQQNGVETRYLLDEGIVANVWEEYSSSGQVRVSYAYGNDLISQTQDSQTTFYLVDGLGSTRLLTDDQGDVLNDYHYDAYGKTIGETGTTENKYLFAGEQFDESLGDYYLRQRYYDIESGRFGRMDTYEGSVEQPLSLHKYIYANANPATMYDPSGFTAGARSSGGIGEATAVFAILAILATIGAITYTATLENTRNKLCRYEIDEDHIFYPDTRFGGVTGFHSTALAEPGYDFEWLDENQIPSTAWNSPYEATYHLVGNPKAKRTSSFFPDIMTSEDVIAAIGEAYIKDGCKPNGDWSESILLPGANVTATVSGSVRPKGNIHFITTAYPSMLRA